ncbi:hypothetical protein M0R45_031695 [Rubus argutus]|uniref:Uncharacterized protein n=1 Tax=Rubus argutus TaxID=59490 RepID=A0AAW1WF21_RUBAR
MNWRKGDEPRASESRERRIRIGCCDCENVRCSENCRGDVAEREKRRIGQFELTGLGNNGWELCVVCEKRRRRELGGVKWRCGGRGLGAWSSGVTRRWPEAMVTAATEGLLS